MKEVHHRIARINGGLILLLALFAASVALVATGWTQFSDDVSAVSSADSHEIVNRSLTSSD